MCRCITSGRPPIEHTATEATEEAIHTKVNHSRLTADCVTAGEHDLSPPLPSCRPWPPVSFRGRLSDRERMCGSPSLVNLPLTQKVPTVPAGALPQTLRRLVPVCRTLAGYRPLPWARVRPGHSGTSWPDGSLSPGSS
jgi:hypothetical protein